MEPQKINRIKVVLVEQGKTGKWLAEQVGKMKLQSLDGVPIECNHPLICLLK